MDAHYFLTNDGKKIASGKMMIHGDFIRDIETREGVKFKTWVYHQVTNTDYKLCCECGRRLNIKTLSTGYGNTIACSMKCLSAKQGERIKQRILKKYGVDNVSRMPSVRRKAEETMLRRYGGRVTMLIPNKAEELREKHGSWGSQRHIEPWVLALSRDKEALRDFYLKTPHSEIEIKLGVRAATFYRWLKAAGIETERHVTEIEAKVAGILEDFGVVYEYGNRSVLNGFEIDFYLPELKIGIECNGIYWHASNTAVRRAPAYHHTKYVRSKLSGVRLFQFWEHEINEDLEYVRGTIERAINGDHVYGVIDNLKPFTLDSTPLIPPRNFTVNGLVLYDAGFSMALNNHIEDING